MNDVMDNLYQDIAARTGGSIYLGVVGPVRTGKSTFVKRVMETAVLPRIENVYQRERAKDELPQSGSGRTIMTSEPKFIPEEAVEISPDGMTKVKIRLIDSVGYLIPGALGVEENGEPRMVTTPWYPEEISMEQAAELGTKKIMEEHCSMGIVITTDGSIHDIPREDFLESEERAITDMKATGKPFLVLVNAADPQNSSAQSICKRVKEKYKVPCLAINCLTLQEEHVQEILSALLFAFPIIEVKCALPDWMAVIPMDHPIKSRVFSEIKNRFDAMRDMNEAERSLFSLQDAEEIDQVYISNKEPGEGKISCEIKLPKSFYFQVLHEKTGLTIKNDGDMLKKFETLAKVKSEYDKVAGALEQVYSTGYGIVEPSHDEMALKKPQIVRKGNSYGVQITASAPSIHMMRVDIEAEIQPMTGDEKQSNDLLQYLLNDYEEDANNLWESKIYGKSVHDLMNESLGNKLKRLPEEARMKLQHTLSRAINEDCSGMVCFILS